jgi:hypothetical protein
MEFLDFRALSTVPFKNLLDYLNVPYKETATELKGETFIITKDKNLFFNPKGEGRGSVINFLSIHRNISLREAAAEIKAKFFETPKEPPKLPDYELDYAHPFLTEQGITPETAKLFEGGYCKHGIMKGKIAFAIHDEKGNKVAYIGKNLKDDGWFFPKNFKSDYLYNLHRQKYPIVILTVSPLDVLKIHQQNIPAVVGLIAHSMSPRQQELLSTFKKILVIHKEPDNIALRLIRNSFVKVVNSVETLNEAAIRALL